MRRRRSRQRDLRVETGLAVWGARTLSVDEPEWKYVSVWRFAVFLESSIAQGIQWAVFEPNGEPLWAQVRLAAEEFMLQLFAKLPSRAHGPRTRTSSVAIGRR